VVGARAQTPRVVEGAGTVVDEVDRTATITALYRDLATLIRMDTHNPEVVAVVAEDQIRPSMVTHH